MEDRYKYSGHYRNECRGIRYISCGNYPHGEADYAWDPAKDRLVSINGEYFGGTGIHRNPLGIRAVVNDPAREQNWHVLSADDITWLQESEDV